MKSKGFTLIELIVSISIVVILSGIILFSVTQYINKGKDSNISGNLAVLIPAGEVYYTGRPNSYQGFCESSVVLNVLSQMPANANGSCDSSAANPTGACCIVENDPFQAWVACAEKFSDSESAFCVDSRGMKKNITSLECSAVMTAALKQCPS